MTMSSTKSTCDIEISLPKEIPRKIPHSFANNNALLKPSTTMRKRSGASGQPCLKPLPALKKDEATPLTNKEKEIEERLLIIQAIKGTVNPILERAILKKVQLTLS